MNNVFISAPYKSDQELVYINMANIALAQPRPGRVGMPGEKKGKTYTSFLMTTHLGPSPTLETLLEWGKFMEIVTPYENIWAPK